MDPYKTLKVPKNASAQAIRLAYRRLSLKYHPDRNIGDAKAEKAFKDVQAAYDVLGDAAKRAHYDATGEFRANQPDNTMAPVLAEACQCFAAVMQELLKNGRDPLKENVAEAMRQMARKHALNLAKQQQELYSGAEHLKSMLGRFLVDDGGENYLESMVKGQLAIVQEQIRRMEGQVELNKQLQALLKRFRFKYDPRKTDYGWSTAGGASAGGFKMFTSFTG